MNMTYQKRPDLRRIAGLLGALALLGLAGCGETADEGQAGSATAAPAETAADADQADSATARDIGPRGDRLGDISLGAEDAPIEIIEYASLTCPHCARFHAATLPRIKEKYIETGKVRYIYRHFVLNQPDLIASTIVRCQGPERFFPLLELFFRRQGDWANQDFLKHLAELARRSGMGQEQFDACLADETLRNAIVAQRQHGAKEYEITGTPTIIVNGKKQELEAQEFDVLDRILQRLL